CVWAGITEAAASQASNVLPAGRPEARRRIRDGRVVAAGGLLGQEDAQDLGVFPALAGGGGDHLRRRSANVWHAQASEQSVELVG
ncbi:MAG: hypothetical protein ACLQA5_00025, partial [Solirubrobacteraceae bacterium]